MILNIIIFPGWNASNTIKKVRDGTWSLFVSEWNITPEEYLKLIGIENPVDQKKILEGNYPDNLTPEEYLKLYGINKTEKEYLARDLSKGGTRNDEKVVRYKKALKEIFPDDPQIFEKSVETSVKCYKFAFEEIQDKAYAEAKKKHPESFAEIEEDSPIETNISKNQKSKAQANISTLTAPTPLAVSIH